jgi:hypothetical protein
MKNNDRRNQEGLNSKKRPQTPLTESNLHDLMKSKFYGEFELTDAIRPAPESEIQPIQGYRHEVYVDQETKSKVPVVMASVGATNVFQLFLELVRRLGPVVDVVLESSHEGNAGEHVDMYRESIDMPVLISTLMEYEDLLVNDGCTGIAVLNPRTPQEVQFEEHKLLIIYGSPLEQFEFLLESHGVPENQKMKLITEGEHVHSSTEAYFKRFQQLRVELGLDGNQEREKFETGETQLFEETFDESHDQAYGDLGDCWRDSYGDDEGSLMN